MNSRELVNNNYKLFEQLMDGCDLVLRFVTIDGKSALRLVPSDEESFRDDIFKKYYSEPDSYWPIRLELIQRDEYKYLVSLIKEIREEVVANS